MPITALVLSLLLAEPHAVLAWSPETVPFAATSLSSSLVPEAAPAPVGVEVAQMAKMSRIERQRTEACEKIRKRFQEALNRKGNSPKRAARLADLQRQKDEKRCEF